jgi:hypothetical protein
MYGMSDEMRKPRKKTPKKIQKMKDRISLLEGIADLYKKDCVKRGEFETALKIEEILNSK